MASLSPEQPVLFLPLTLSQCCASLASAINMLEMLNHQLQGICAPGPGAPRAAVTSWHFPQAPHQGGLFLIKQLPLPFSGCLCLTPSCNPSSRAGRSDKPLGKVASMADRLPGTRAQLSPAQSDKPVGIKVLMADEATGQYCCKLTWTFSSIPRG